jgi:D-alanyl-D-alanine carboxypeptidase
VTRFLIPFALVLTTLAHGDAVDDYLRGEMKRSQIPGLTYGIIRDGKLVRSGAFGKADLELDTPMKVDNLCEIGSITKQFTAFATMMLVESGKIGLDDPISKYLPEAKENWKEITVRNLLNQTSGLQEYVFVPGLGLDKEFDRKQFMDSMTPLPLDFAPGLTWSYSNTNYALMGFVIEKAAGVPYTQFVQEQIFKPAGMTSTKFMTSGDVMVRRAHGYLLDGTRYLSLRGTGSLASDGTITSNIADMAKWDAVLNQRKLLSATSYETMWTRAKLKSGHTRAYGMGWDLTPRGGAPFVGHAGASVGYSAGFVRFLKPKLSVVVLGNVYAFNGEGVARGVAEILDPKLRTPQPVEVGSDPDSTRVTRVQAALAAMAARKADESLLDPEMTAPMKTGRAMMSNLFAQVASLQHIGFCSAEADGADAWVTYRIQAKDRWFTLIVLYTKEGRVAQIGLAGDPPVAAPKRSG